MTEHEFCKDFGEAVFALLYESGMSRRELAFKAGISDATLSRIASERHMPSLRTAMNIANALQVPIEFLIGNDIRID